MINLTGESSSLLSYPVPGACGYPADTLQVPCLVSGLSRYPERCQGYPGTLQVSCPGSGISRDPAGALGLAEIGLLMVGSNHERSS